MSRRPILRRITLVTAFASFGAGSAAAAEPTTASLSWVRLPGSESCVPAQSLARDVEKHLGKSVFVSPSIAGLVIEGRVESDENGGFTATLHATRADGTDLGVRTLASQPGEACRSLDENLALVLALMIDPDAVARAREVNAAPPPSPPPSSPPPKPPPPRVVIKTERVLVPVERPEPDEPWTGEARAALTVSGGVLPGAALGFLASGQVDPPGFWPIELTGYGWTEREAEVAGGGATFSMMAASLSACPSTSVTDSLRATACVGFLGGALRARGFGFDQVNEGTKPVVALVSSLRLALDVSGPLFVSGGMGLHAAVVRPRYLLNEPDGSERDVFQMAAVGGIGEIGLGLRFHP